MDAWFGKIEIEKIGNNRFSPGKEDGFKELNDTHVKVVHYPDCQQLLIWLTHPGWEYGTIRLCTKKGKLIEEWPVSDKLNGSIQLVWDTLPVKPGTYTIGIDWKKEGQHLISFTKYKEGAEKNKTGKPVKAEVQKKKEKKKDEPIEYRDGFGKPIPNEDLILREQLEKDIAAKFNRRIEFEGNFRSGKIIYTEGETRIEFIHEMGGGNCMFYIEIPTEKQWEAHTKTALSRRKDILEYIARWVQVRQASNCNVGIKNDSIVYTYK